MGVIKVLLISIFNIMRILYLPIAFIHSLILFTLMLTDRPMEDVDFYIYLLQKTTKDFLK